MRPKLALFALLILLPTMAMAELGRCTAIFASTPKARLESVVKSGDFASLDGLVFRDLEEARQLLTFDVRMALSKHGLRGDSWLPIESRPSTEKEEARGTFEGTYANIQARQSQLLELSREKMIGVGGANLYRGVFVPNSYFMLIASSGRTFPKRDILEKELDRQAHLVWHPDGSVTLHTLNMRQHLVDRLRRDLGSKTMTVYRGQSAFDRVTVELVRALTNGRETATAESSLREILAADPKHAHNLEKLKGLTGEAFARTLIEEIRPVPYLFTTPELSWAHYFARQNQSEPTRYELNLEDLPASYRDRIFLGADGAGMRPYHLEIAFPFATLEEALLAGRALKP